MMPAAEASQVGIDVRHFESLCGFITSYGSVVAVVVLHELWLWHWDSQWGGLWEGGGGINANYA